MNAVSSTRNKPWRVGVVGAGFFSQFHLDGWVEVPGVEVVGLVDPDHTKAAALANRFGIRQSFHGLAQMLEAVEVDLVDLVTPPAAQHTLLTQLQSRGLPVICQKPFGTSYEQARGFTEAFAKAQTPLIVHENFRFMPWYRELRRLVDLGHFGDLHQISFRLRPGDGQGPSAYLDRQPYFQTMPRLLVAETAIHFIDVFRFIAGEVSAVLAQLRRINPAICGEDAAIIAFEFANGCAGVFDGNRLNAHPSTNLRRTMGEMWLEGSNGVMRLDGQARLWWLPHQGDETEHHYERGPELGFGGGACGALQRHVLQALTQQAPIENTASDYLRNLLIQEAVYASHQSGQRIEIGSFTPPPHSAPVAAMFPRPL